MPPKMRKCWIRHEAEALNGRYGSGVQVEKYLAVAVGMGMGDGDVEMMDGMAYVFVFVVSGFRVTLLHTLTSGKKIVISILFVPTTTI